MTDTMKAIVLAKFGGFDAFEMRDATVPVVGPRQVRVRVHATAINPLDYQIRRGDYADYVPLPAIIGHDVSGVVEEKGADVSEFDVGDEVYYTPKIFGGPGCVCGAARCRCRSGRPQAAQHQPSGGCHVWSLVGTVWEALVTRAQLAVHETILIHGGGAGGVGTVAIQLAKAMGARVITTARRSNHEFGAFGAAADEVIDHSSDDDVSAVAELTHGQGVNVVFDTIGGDTLTRSALALADAGRLVSIVDIAQPQNLIEAWGKNAAYHFVFTRQNRGKLDALTNLIERGLIKPVIGAVFPLARLGEKRNQPLEGGSSRGLRGKVAIDVVGQTVELPTPR
ncbi:alcohol dehydrogenase catalytic domain-containing protein [Rhizobium yanglingense]